MQPFEWMLPHTVLKSDHTVLAQSSGNASKPLISTGVIGSINISGLDDPQYVLVFPVQRLMAGDTSFA
jgi:hypothetical protein